MKTNEHMTDRTLLGHHIDVNAGRRRSPRTGAEVDAWHERLHHAGGWATHNHVGDLVVLDRGAVLLEVTSAARAIDELRTLIRAQGGIGDDPCGDVLDELDEVFTHLTTAESFVETLWGSEDD